EPHGAGTAEIDGGRGPRTHPLRGHHRAQPVLVVVDPITHVELERHLVLPALVRAGAPGPAGRRLERRRTHTARGDPGADPTTPRRDRAGCPRLPLSTRRGQP